MSSASDISNLFQMLGVSPSQYQEVARTEQAQGSRGSWSMQTEPVPGDTTRDDAAPAQPVLQSSPEPAIAAQQPVVPGAVSAHLPERNESQADVRQPQMS
jgi:hypothetical protein